MLRCSKVQRDVTKFQPLNVCKLSFASSKVLRLISSTTLRSTAHANRGCNNVLCTMVNFSRFWKELAHSKLCPISAGNSHCSDVVVVALVVLVLSVAGVAGSLGGAADSAAGAGGDVSIFSSFFSSAFSGCSVSFFSSFFSSGFSAGAGADAPAVSAGFVSVGLLSAVSTGFGFGCNRYKVVWSVLIKFSFHSPQ